MAVQAPRVNDRRVDPVTGQRIRFRSVLLPPWCRKSPKVAEVLLLLYLHGLHLADVEEPHRLPPPRQPTGSAVRFHS